VNINKLNAARKNSDYRRTFQQKIALVVFGIVAAVVILECLLRISGYAILFTQKRENRKGVAGAKAYTILCPGDSFTYGLGDAKGEDYSLQLKGDA
jgi:hypothetical protein